MTDDTGHRTSLVTWAGLTVAVVATIAVTGVADWFVMFGQSSTCYDPPDPDEVRAGRIALATVVAVAAAPWALGAVMSRHRVAVVVAGVVAVGPAILVFLNGLRTDAWVGGFCF